jgi:aryl carrier-like protein
LEYVGRQDDEVNINGVRIDPAEIAVGVRQAPGVRDAAVIPIMRADAEPLLVAFFVPGNATVSPTTVSKHLEEHLPPHLRPVTYIPVAQLPITHTGKVYRERLIALYHARRRGSTPHADAIETALCEIWSDLLGDVTLNPEDDLFELGADSISVIRAVVRARSRGIALSEAEIFQSRTVAALAARVRLRRGDSAMSLERSRFDDAS